MNDNKLTKEALTAFAAQNRDRFESLLKDFVERPTVSVDPSRKPAIAECVTLACETIKAFGGVAEVLTTSGHPIVHGVFGSDPARPTVTVYNHLDVQPASKQTEPWETEPFVFTKKGDRYFGRGTTDDKGPALSALFGAKAAMDAGVPVNVRVLWEFEEEIGSPSFAKGI
ncbi:MAG: M20/M25/M40 family metallo-hydrolase, partial [Acidobacteriota bacterium]